MIVLVLLLEDALHYFFVAVVLDVVAAEHCHAEGDLFALVLTDVISLVHLYLLSFVERVLFWEIEKIDVFVSFHHMRFGVHIGRIFWLCPELYKLL